MKRNTTFKQTDFIIKQENSDIRLEPKLSTINFLLSYSRVLHVEKLSNGKTIGVILN